MLPLGDMWEGECGAPQGGIPDAPTSRQFCNMGYSRGRCGAFPEGDGPDAVRFALEAADGPLLRIAYALERGHFPFELGMVECSAESGEVARRSGTWDVSPQAHAYALSYLRRKASCATP
jgi:hypothetical protein